MRTLTVSETIAPSDAAGIVDISEAILFRSGAGPEMFKSEATL
jgi:hypothetical protein